MKAACLLLLVSLPVAALAVEVQNGDSLATVRTALGVPRGQLKIGSRQLLYYDRGEVELQGGEVTRVALMSEADLSALEARRTADAARMSEETVRRNAEGEALKARMLTNSTFLAAPLSYQLAFWQNFSLRYPGVPVDEQLTVTRLRLAQQYDQQQAQEERLAELEARVNAAETRAREGQASVYPIEGYGYGGYGYYGGYAYNGGGRGRHSSTLFPIQYHFSNTLGPIITPFNPNNVPISQRSSTGGANASNCNRRGRM